MEIKIFHKILNEIPTYTRFLKVSEIDNLINLITELPDVKYEKIGKTVDNEPLGMLEIGKNDKTALIIGVPHSDEPLGNTSRIKLFWMEMAFYSYTRTQRYVFKRRMV